MTVQSDEEYPSGPSFGPIFIELLLLALIDGHELGRESTLSRRNRLDAAMKVITGDKSSPNAFPDDKDDQACVFMGDEHFRDKYAQTYYDFRNRKGKNVAMERPKLRSFSELARLAEKQFFDSTDDGARNAIANRLRERFSGVYQKKLKQGAQANYPATYVYRAVEQDDVQSSFEKQDLKKIGEILGRYGIAYKI